jgi:hypothetical protein
VAIAPAARNHTREGRTMHVAAKRAIVAAAAVAAAGLYGSLSYDGAVVAQQGVPTVHRDVALVDSPLDVDDTAIAAASAAAPTAGEITTFLTAENTFNGDAYGTFFGTSPTTGFEYELYHGLAPNSALFLDTYDVSGALPTTGLVDGGPTQIFDGATSQYLDGVYADGLLLEDYGNQLLGVPAAQSETDILGQIEGADKFVALTPAETTAITAAEGSTGSTFDGDLAGLAQAFYTQSATDLGGYDTYLSTDATQLATADFSLSTVLGDVSTDLNSAVSGLSTDFSTFIAALDVIGGF